MCPFTCVNINVRCHKTCVDIDVGFTVSMWMQGVTVPIWRLVWALLYLC